MFEILNIRVKIFVSIVFSVLPFISSTCVAKEQLVWLGADFPPAFISQGPNANQGHINKIEQY